MVIQEREVSIGGSNRETEINKRLPLTVFLGDERARDVTLTGGKGAGLAGLRSIPKIKVPEAFVVTATLSDQILRQNPHIADMISALDQHSLGWLKAKLAGNEEAAEFWSKQVAEIGEIIKEEMNSVKLSPEAANTIINSYNELCQKVGKENVRVAVRSSGICEDGSEFSFAGQNETYLHQQGKEEVIEATVRCISSQFGARAIEYRNEARLKLAERSLEKKEQSMENALTASKNFSHAESGLAVVVQEMADGQASGIGFSIDSKTGAKVIRLDVNYGLGEAIVSGRVTPDSYEVDPRIGAIIGRSLGEKAVKTAYVKGRTREVKVSLGDRKKFAISDSTVKNIAEQIAIIKDHHGEEVDVEFVIKDGEVWLTQARPETVVSQEDPMIVKMRSNIVPEGVGKNAEMIFKGGETGSPGAANGIMTVVRTIKEAKQAIEEYGKKGEKIILVTERTDPDWVPIMKKVGGIITRVGGTTCHAAIVSRELGVPCIIGVGDKIESLTKHVGSTITIDANGKIVYKGKLPLEEVGEDIDVRELLENPTKTVIGINIANIDQARILHALAELGKNFKISLLRTEFLLEDIGVHINALVDFDNGKIAQDSDLYKRIADKIAGYGSAENYFKTKLTEGISAFAALFPDSPITLRTTDFKTNEYKSLIGGKEYEPEEPNPMLGDRGLLRFLRPENRTAFKWELEAIKKARESGYENIEVMFPMVHDPRELTGDPELTEKGFRGAFEIMDEVGMGPGRDGLRVGIMVEVPTNAIRIRDFITTGIQFVSIGSNDLTQFGLAVDRDNERLKLSWLGASNPAIVQMIKDTIEVCNELGIDIGICGQEPSDNPDFARKLVEFGIGSIGVTPDTFKKTHKFVRGVERSRNKQSAAPTVLFP